MGAGDQSSSRTVTQRKLGNPRKPEKNRKDEFS